MRNHIHIQQVFSFRIFQSSTKTMLSHLMVHVPSWKTLLTSWPQWCPVVSSVNCLDLIDHVIYSRLVSSRRNIKLTLYQILNIRCFLISCKYNTIKKKKAFGQYMRLSEWERIIQQRMKIMQSYLLKPIWVSSVSFETGKFTKGQASSSLWIYCSYRKFLK